MHPNAQRSQLADGVVRGRSAMRPGPLGVPNALIFWASQRQMPRWHRRCYAYSKCGTRTTPLELPAMIRDTSAQDRRIQTEHPRRRWIVIGAVGAAVLAALIWVVPTVARLLSAGVSASTASLRIAE